MEFKPLTCGDQPKIRFLVVDDSVFARKNICKMLGSASSGTTRLAVPASIAARGMLSTTQVSMLCAMVTPPAACTARMPSAPSSPIPVMRTAALSDPNSLATE